MESPVFDRNDDADDESGRQSRLRGGMYVRRVYDDAGNNAVRRHTSFYYVYTQFYYAHNPVGEHIEPVAEYGGGGRARI